MGTKLWPIIITELVGGPHDGDVHLMLAGQGPEPPETLPPSAGAGRYVRHPEKTGRWRWEFLWCKSRDGDLGEE